MHVFNSVSRSVFIYGIVVKLSSWTEFPWPTLRQTDQWDLSTSHALNPSNSTHGNLLSCPPSTRRLSACPPSPLHHYIVHLNHTSLTQFSPTSLLGCSFSLIPITSLTHFAHSRSFPLTPITILTSPLPRRTPSTQLSTNTTALNISTHHCSTWQHPCIHTHLRSFQKRSATRAKQSKAKQNKASRVYANTSLPLIDSTSCISSQRRTHRGARVFLAATGQPSLRRRQLNAATIAVRRVLARPKRTRTRPNDGKRAAGRSERGCLHHGFVALRVCTSDFDIRVRRWEGDEGRASDSAMPQRPWLEILTARLRRTRQPATTPSVVGPFVSCCTYVRSLAGQPRLSTTRNDVGWTTRVGIKRSKGNETKRTVRSFNRRSDAPKQALHPLATSRWPLENQRGAAQSHPAAELPQRPVRPTRAPPTREDIS